MLNFLNLKSLVMINFVKFVNFFRALIEKVDITQELKMAGNVTIFSPLNEAFDKLPIKIENQSLSSIRRVILRHFVKGFLFKRDMENGTVSIWYFVTKIVLVIEKNFSNSRLKAENLQKF